MLVSPSNKFFYLSTCCCICRDKLEGNHSVQPGCTFGARGVLLFLFVGFTFGQSQTSCFSHIPFIFADMTVVLIFLSNSLQKNGQICTAVFSSHFVFIIHNNLLIFLYCSFNIFLYFIIVMSITKCTNIPRISSVTGN